jgi:hypothetical protein
MNFLTEVRNNSFLSSTESETTNVTNSESQMLKSLISRAGDLTKNNDRLKFALVSIRYPEAYDEI